MLLGLDASKCAKECKSLLKTSPLLEHCNKKGGLLKCCVRLETFSFFFIFTFLNCTFTASKSNEYLSGEIKHSAMSVGIAVHFPFVATKMNKEVKFVDNVLTVPINSFKGQKCW